MEIALPHVVVGSRLAKTLATLETGERAAVKMKSKSVHKAATSRHVHCLPQVRLLKIITSTNRPIWLFYIFRPTKELLSSFQIPKTRNSQKNGY